MAYINAQLPIKDVAEALELRFDGNGHIHCWYPERHKNGDRTASVGINKQQNYLKCFGCGTPPLHPLNLVIDVKGVSPLEAAQWIAERFRVPCLPKHAPARAAFRVVDQIGLGGPLKPLVVSGLFARMSQAARNVAVTLSGLSTKQRDRAVYEIQVSYRGIVRYSGMTSHTAVRKGLVELSELKWLKFPAEDRGRHLSGRVATYTLTPDGDEFLEIANAVARATAQAITIEKALRASRRVDRVRTARERQALALRDLPTNGTSQGYYYV